MKPEDRSLWLGIGGACAGALVLWAGNYYLENRRVEQEAAAKRAALTARIDDWQQNKAKYTAELDAALNRGDTNEARMLLGKYFSVSGGDLKPHSARLEVIEKTVAFNAIPKNEFIRREGAAGELATIDPGNPRWAKEIASAKADRDREAKVVAAKRAQQEKVDLAQRRREGVAVGMTEIARSSSPAGGAPRRSTRRTTGPPPPNNGSTAAVTTCIFGTDGWKPSSGHDKRYFR